jgi:hypothetical protein
MMMILPDIFLHKLAEWRPAGTRQTLHVPIEGTGWGLALTADRNDELGSLVWELALHRSGEPVVAADVLTGWAKRVAGRATGLLEPLKVIEVDAERSEALLRSNEPLRRGEQLYYYEVHLKNNTSATLCRYRALNGNGKREQVAFALTHEALAKLVADLTAES